jgi:ClpP class serine protease
MSNKVWAVDESNISLAKEISAIDKTLLDTTVKSNILTVQGNTAIISVKGTLGFTPNLMQQIMGVVATSYEDIVEAVELANTDDAIEQIALDVNSGGGVVNDSLWSASDAIYASKKPVTAYVSNNCCSGAYLLASQASEGIIARHDLTNIGSIGVIIFYKKPDEKMGVMRSSNASLKNANPEQYPEQYQAKIDAVEKYFINHISRSLGLTTDKIVADFGKGATITALEALERGMIKEIYTPNMLNFGKSKEQPEAQVEQTEQATSVDVGQIKAESYQAGIVAERERVATLTEFAAKYNAPEAAANAIKEGLSVQDCMEAMLQEQQRNLTAKANQQEVETVAVADTQETDLSAEQSRQDGNANGFNNVTEI